MALVGTAPESLILRKSRAGAPYQC